VRIPHDAPVPALVSDRGLSPFALFAACILGVTESDGFRVPNPQEVGRRFGLSQSALSDALRALALDVESLEKSGFDLAGARMDVQVAPPGVSRTEVAKDLYKDLLQLPKRATVVAAAASRISESLQDVAASPSDDASGGAAE
jgi:hypothetical protein